jgi:site-specific DNA-adenine methylase
VSYTADGFDKDAHKALFDICNGFTAKNIEKYSGLAQVVEGGIRTNSGELCSKEVGMLMSNADVELVREAFKDDTKYEVRTISCRRAIHSTNPEARTNEVMIRNII